MKYFEASVTHLKSPTTCYTGLRRLAAPQRNNRESKNNHDELGRGKLVTQQHGIEFTIISNKDNNNIEQTNDEQVTETTQSKRFHLHHHDCTITSSYSLPPLFAAPLLPCPEPKNDLDKNENKEESNSKSQTTTTTDAPPISTTCMGHDCLEKVQVFCLFDALHSNKQEKQKQNVSNSQSFTSQSFSAETSRSNSEQMSKNPNDRHDNDKPMAWIVWKQDDEDGEEEVEEMESKDNEKQKEQGVNLLTHHHHKGSVHASLGLSIRPLAPTLARLIPQESTKLQKYQQGIVLFFGSADDALLHCVVCTQRRRRQQQQQIDDDEEANDQTSKPQQYQLERINLFGQQVFKSPVMTIEWQHIPKHSGENSNNDNLIHHEHCLAVGCQDGTVSLIYFKCRLVVKKDKQQQQEQKQYPQAFDIHTKTVIVDGPIMSVRFHLQQQSRQLFALAGSMWGYVCQFSLKLDQNYRRHDDSFLTEQSSLQETDNTGNVKQQTALSWNGPSMVVEGLWNPMIQANDAVLSVHYWSSNHVIVVGTLSGQLHIYGQVRHNDHQLVWKRQLPHAVHSIADFGPTHLVVTTKQSIHIFCPYNNRPRLESSLSSILQQIIKKEERQ